MSHCRIGGGANPITPTLNGTSIALPAASVALKVLSSSTQGLKIGCLLAADTTLADTNGKAGAAQSLAPAGLVWAVPLPMPARPKSTFVICDR
ncbi:hypothetical protein D3C86_1731210 [compost metagenome]